MSRTSLGLSHRVFTSRCSLCMSRPCCCCIAPARRTPARDQELKWGEARAPNSGEGLNELRRGDQELARGGGWREHRISAGSTEVRSDLNGRVAANNPPGVCGGWYHLLNTILLDLGQASRQSLATVQRWC